MLPKIIEVIKFDTSLTIQITKVKESELGFLR